MAEHKGGSEGSGGWPSFSGLDPETQRQIKSLEGEIAGLKQEVAGCEDEARRLQAREMAGQGTFAKEIYALKQRKLTLLTEVQLRRAHVNRLRLGI